MRKKIAVFLIFLICGVLELSVEAKVGRGGGGMRSGMGSRGGGGISRGGGSVSRGSGNFKRGSGSVDRAKSGNISRPSTGSRATSGANRAAIDRSTTGNVNRGVDRTTNRNVNRDVNRDIDRDFDRDIDIDGGWGGLYYDDPGWGWGSFAAGAAGVAAGAAIGAAIDDDDDTVVVNTPVAGSYVPSIPSGCALESSGGATLYNCDGILYEPYYEGSTLVYRVVS